jgi:hypothetical protein
VIRVLSVRQAFGLQAFNTEVYQQPCFKAIRFRVIQGVRQVHIFRVIAFRSTLIFGMGF